MKLATLNDGTRDGQLVVVRADLSRYTPAGKYAGTLQQALDKHKSKFPVLPGLTVHILM